MLKSSSDGEAMQGQLLKRLALITAALGGALSVALAQTANENMPGCRAYFALSNVAGQTSFDAGFCAGVITGLMVSDPTICRPKGITRGQAVRVVVQYIDGIPARHHEQFLDLAFEALNKAWPCPLNKALPAQQ